MTGPVRIEVLGELRVLAPDGSPVELPASRKTRALLAYLALTGRPQFREHLCQLLWDGPEDPRGALRWSLSRIRAGVDTRAGKRISSDRRTVGLAKDAFSIDLRDAEQAMNAEAPPTLEVLRSTAALFRGDLLEGLELLDSFRFHAWCVGQREAARALRLRVLTALIEATPDGDEALEHAHALVSIDPLSEAAHAQVIRLLVQMQRHGDAQDQLDAYRRTLEMELGEVPREVSARLRKLVHSEGDRPRPRAPAPRVPEPAVSALPMVGRARELETLIDWFRSSRSRPPMAVISGDPGVGKTRLMAELVRRLGDEIVTIHGRAYRAESARPFGPWRDAIAAIEGSASVLTSVGEEGSEKDQREHLFDELLRLLGAHASERRPLLITLDDAQWLDEASSAFLHLLVRSNPPHVALVATVRGAEIMDNPAMSEALESLQKERALLELALSPLAAGEVRAICAAVDAGIDADEVFRRSEGNPFVATEIARALARGETALPDNTRRLIETRLHALSEPARELLPWAAALGRTFHVDVLERVTGLDPVALVERVGELEERGVFEPHASGVYDFTHDLVRDAAYRALSAPRQRIVHRSIARSLEGSRQGELGVSAVELLRHAELGGELAMACRASATAVRDAFRLCAWVDALNLCDRGLQHLDALGPDEFTDTALELLEYRVNITSILGRPHPDHTREVLRKVLERASSPEQRGKLLLLQALVTFEHGDQERAEQELVAAADSGRQSDPEAAARQSANSARCLLHIESEVGRARGLLSEARAGLESMGLEDVELLWAEALLARWDGDLEGAIEHMQRAIVLAKETDAHWRQSSGLTALVMITSEAGDDDRVEALCREGYPSSDDDVDPLKSPFVEALAALADFRRDARSDARLSAAIELLRSRGAAAQLCYVLAEEARLLADRGQLDAAEAAATEAGALGESCQRRVPWTDALVTVALVRGQRGDQAGATAALQRARELAAPGDAVTRRVRERLERVARSLESG